MDTVLTLDFHYDATCSCCRRVAQWLRDQAHEVPIRITATTPPGGSTSLLTSVTSDGAVYRGTKAFLMALWATSTGRAKLLDRTPEEQEHWAREVFEHVAGLDTL